MGSQSDHLIMKDCEKILKILKVKYKVLIVSAHRTPKRMFDFAEKAEKNGFGVIVAGAGGAAHLAGMVRLRHRYRNWGHPTIFARPRRGKRRCRRSSVRPAHQARPEGGWAKTKSARRSRWPAYGGIFAKNTSGTARSRVPETGKPLLEACPTLPLQKAPIGEMSVTTEYSFS